MCQFLHEDQFDYRIPSREEEELQQQRDYAADFLESLLDKFYGSQDLDLLETENHLDELCYCLGVRPRKGDLTIQRQK